MQTYRQFIDSRFSVRQILVEHQHFNDEEKRAHLYDMLCRCPGQNAIPIINYNDPVSYEENRKHEIGRILHAIECVDNDETASQIACLVKCKTLLIMTTTDGIYSDPDDEKTLVTRVGGKDVYELIENVEELQSHCAGASRKERGARRAGETGIHQRAFEERHHRHHRQQPLRHKGTSGRLSALHQDRLVKKSARMGS